MPEDRVISRTPLLPGSQECENRSLAVSPGEPLRAREPGGKSWRKRCSLPYFPRIDPRTSSFLAVWDAMVCISNLVLITLVPYDAAFYWHVALRPNSVLLAFFCLDFFFAADMGLQLCVVNPDSHETPTKLAKKYLLGFFGVDVVSFVPTLGFFSYLLGVDHHRQCLGVRLHKLQMMSRLLRLARLHQFPQIAERRAELWGFSFAQWLLMKFTTIAFITAHWMACLWAGMAVQGMEWASLAGANNGSRAGDMDSPREKSWLDAYQDFVGTQDGGFCTTPRGVYLVSLYWSIMSLTSNGFGDVSPQNLSEYLVCSFCMVVMGTTWTYVVSRFCEIYSTLSPHEVEFERTMDTVNLLLQDYAMPEDTRKITRSYFNDSRDLWRRQNEQEVIEQFSPMLQGATSLHLLKGWVRKVKYLQWIHDIDIEIAHQEHAVTLARILQSNIYVANEILDGGEALCVIQGGLCIRAGRVLVSGDIWGEDVILSNPCLRNTDSVRCLCTVCALSVQRLDLLEFLRRAPEFQAQIRRARAWIALSRAIKLIRRELKAAVASGAGEKWFVLLENTRRSEAINAILHGRFSQWFETERHARHTVQKLRTTEVLERVEKMEKSHPVSSKDLRVIKAQVRDLREQAFDLSNEFGIDLPMFHK